MHAVRALNPYIAWVFTRCVTSPISLKLKPTKSHSQLPSRCCGRTLSATCSVDHCLSPASRQLRSHPQQLSQTACCHCAPSFLPPAHTCNPHCSCPLEAQPHTHCMPPVCVLPLPPSTDRMQSKHARRTPSPPFQHANKPCAASHMAGARSHTASADRQQHLHLAEPNHHSANQKAYRPAVKASCNESPPKHIHTL